MSTDFFLPFRAGRLGGDAADGLSFRHYDKDRMVAGKRMEDQLRFAVCYWHSFVWPGTDPFGGETFMRPWQGAGDGMELARQKADVAFDLFRSAGRSVLHLP